MISCSDKKKEKSSAENVYVDPRESQTMQRSKTDTVAVLYNVNEYLRKLKENKIDSALDMLYEASGDSVIPVSSKRKEEIRKLVEVFPVLSYQIDELKMYSEQDTEVRYTIKYYEKADNDPRQNTLQCVINPRRVGYYWFLTVDSKTIETNYQDD